MERGSRRGIVKGGRLVPLGGGAPWRLTGIQPQEAMAPEQAELSLAAHEGALVEVEGLDQGGWIYAARVFPLIVRRPEQVFRANVGIIVANVQGLVLEAERSGVPGGWQLPQGGIDPGVQPVDAVYRELDEELGLRRDDVELVGAYPGWLGYELPEAMRKHGRGQCQRWFLLRLTADEAAIDLARWPRAHGQEPEFQRWRWSTMRSIAGAVWPPRAASYLELASFFRRELALV